jgi:hypothetical protein
LATNSAPKFSVLVVGPRKAFFICKASEVAFRFCLPSDTTVVFTRPHPFFAPAAGASNARLSIASA